MMILLVQTACNYHQVLLIDDQKESGMIVREWRQELPRETLSFLMKVLRELDQYSAIDRLLFIQGPGSFTALRVGATWVNALAFARKLPVAVINTLEYVALLKFQNIQDLALTFDEKRFFMMQGASILASEQAPSLPIIHADQNDLWFDQTHIKQLASFPFINSPYTEVLYIIPPKITPPKKQKPTI